MLIKVYAYKGKLTSICYLVVYSNYIRTIINTIKTIIRIALYLGDCMNFKITISFIKTSQYSIMP